MLGFVQTYDQKPRQRVWEVMKSQRMQENQQVVFMSDGGEDVRQVQEYLHPNSEHVIDWFHITMRLTVLQQQTKALQAEIRALKELETMAKNYGFDVSMPAATAREDTPFWSQFASRELPDPLAQLRVHDVPHVGVGDHAGIGPPASASRRGDRCGPGVAPLIGTMHPAMAIRPILTAEAPILRERTKKVSTFDASLHRLLDDMLVTMRDAPGVGLAANQIGVPLQVAVIEVDDTITELVNPQIVKGSGEQIDWEGCLSIPGPYHETKRYARITCSGQDVDGAPLEV